MLFTLCIIHREHLAATKPPADLKNVLDNVLKTVNEVRCWILNSIIIIIIVSRAQRPVGALCVEPIRFTRARHSSRSCARGSIGAGSRTSWSRSRLTTSIQRVRGAPRGRFQPNEPGSKSRIAREGWCGGMRSTCPYQRTRRRAAKEEAVQQGPAPFHLRRGRASECQESISEPHCQSRQAWRRGFQWEARSPRRTAAQIGLLHCICASWWYAKWTAGTTMACEVPASHSTIVRVCALELQSIQNTVGKYDLPSLPYGRKMSFKRTSFFVSCLGQVRNKTV